MKALTISEPEFRSMLNFWVSADPFWGSDGARCEMYNLLDRLSKEMGYKNPADAYRNL